MFFFFNDTAPTEIYTLSLHHPLPFLKAKPASGSRSTLPRCAGTASPKQRRPTRRPRTRRPARPASGASPSAPRAPASAATRSEEHTSELQSRQYLVCRLLLEKKKDND